MPKELEMTDLSDYPKKVELKDGTQVCLRPMRKDDRDRLYTFFKNLPARSRRFFKHDVTQREVITNWCRHLDYDQVLPILAIIKDEGHEKVVADSTLHAQRHGWDTHVAQVRWVIAPSMKKKGLSKIILRELYDRAVQRGIQKIQSTIRADDSDAITVLKRLGFRKEATFKKHAMDRRGKLHDILIYFNDLSDLWQKMEDLNIDSDFFILP
jgi:RimJ/RimL family protein N-acetyltransferase